MVKTVATIAFIGVCAAGALYLAQRETVARGDVLEADLMKMLEKRGITKLDCDDAIPIGPRGATFRCQVEAKDGTRGVVRYQMDRAGRIVGTVVDAERRQPLPETSGDPWGN